MSKPLPATAQTIVDDLRDRILSGELVPGDRLPTYAELCELYGVSHGTAARAILLLRERGYAVGLQGKGVYVAERKS